MTGRFKRQLVIGVAALAVAAFAGGAYAATQSTGPSTRQAFLDDVAKRLHVTPQQLSAALDGAYIDQLQAAVKAGQLTQAQANALEQRLKSTGSSPLPFGLPEPGGLGRLHGFRAFGPPGGGIGAIAALPAAASYLGLTNAALVGQLGSGKSLAQIATSTGKTVAGLEQAMTASVKSKLDTAVADKDITATQEQQILSRWSTRLRKLVNSSDLGFRPDGFLFRNPRVPYGPGAGGPPGPPADGPMPPATLPLPSGPPPSA